MDRNLSHGAWPFNIMRAATVYTQTPGYFTSESELIITSRQHVSPNPSYYEQQQEDGTHRLVQK